MTVQFFKKAICLLLMPLLIISTAIPPASAAYNKLAPHDFYEMYALAANGKISKLSNAIHRGLDIDAVNQNGDTGLCVAAKQKNAKAYNTFRNLGANPAHPCTRNIPHYQSFVNSRAVQTGAFWQESSYAPPAYNMENSSSDKWKLAGLLLLLGGGAAILLSGGGGGGGSDDEPAENPGLSCEYGCAEEDENGNCLVCNDEPTPVDPCEEDPCAEGCYTNITCGPGETCSQQNACGGCEACTMESVESNKNFIIEEDGSVENSETLTNTDTDKTGSWGGIHTSSGNIINHGNITLERGDGALSNNVAVGIMATTESDMLRVLINDTIHPTGIYEGNIINTGDILSTVGGFGIVADGLMTFYPDSPAEHPTYEPCTLTNSGEITISGGGTGILLLGDGILNNGGAINLDGRTFDFTVKEDVIGNGRLYQFISPSYHNTGISFIPRTASAIVTSSSLTNSGKITIDKDITKASFSSPYGSSLYEHFLSVVGINVVFDNSSPPTVNNFGSIEIKASGNEDLSYLSDERKRWYVVGLSVVYPIFADYIDYDSRYAANVENSGSIYLSGNAFMHGISVHQATLENKGDIFIDMDTENYDIATRDFISVGIKAHHSFIDQYGDIDYQISGIGGYFYAASLYNSTLNIHPGATLSGTIAAYNSTINNSGTVNVKVESADEAANGIYGLWLTGDSGGYNEGIIQIDTPQEGIGVYAEQTETDGFENKGSIIVNSTNGIGMYANGYDGGIHDRYAKLINSGRIAVTGDNSIGMYANGANSIIINTGTIIANGNNSQQTATSNRGTISNGSESSNTKAQAFKLTNGAKFYNLGVLEAEDSLNLDALADEKSKTVADLTTGSNDDHYESRVIEAEENNATAASNSAMFAAEMLGDKIAMTRYNFNELMEDKNLASYLENNYQQGNRVDTFDTFKTAESTTTLNNMVAETLGTDFVPAFAYQNFARLRHINRTMADLMQNNASDKDERVSVVSNNYYHDIKAHGGVSGYEERLFGFSGLFDKKINNNFRYGIGLGIYRADADFDNSVNRDDNLFEVYNPYWFDYERWGALIMPYAGYSDGDYERHNGAKKYTADLRAYYYGLNNRIYLKTQTAGINIEPTAEINLNGIYQDDSSEDDGISLKAKNMFSAETGLGAYISKAADFGTKGKLNLKAGAMYYYELNDDAYQSINARFAGMSSLYKITGYDNSRSRGIVSLRANYQFKGWNLYAEITRLLEHNDNMVYNAGLKYSF